MQRILTKTKELFHSLLVERRKNVPEGQEDGNTILLSNPDPNIYIECTPKRDIESSEHLDKGHVLIYTELANSVPIAEDGHSFAFPLDMWQCSQYRYGGRQVYSESIIARMNRNLVGKRICSYRCGKSTYGERINDWGIYRRGEFVKSWILRKEVDGGIPIGILCGLAWVEKPFYDECLKGSDYSYLSFYNSTHEDCYRNVCVMCGEPADCSTMKKCLDGELDWYDAAFHSLTLMNGFESFDFLYFCELSDIRYINPPIHSNDEKDIL